MQRFDIVVDTNVVIAAQRSRRGASNELLRRLNDPRIALHVSNTLLFEYDEILHREQAVIGLTDQQISDLLDGFCSFGVKHYISFLWRPVLRDPDDDFLLDLAATARATHIVTHNVRDLAAAGQFGINVVTPAQFLGILRTSV
jgi:putative PIN family toxin of toxin-antitoxin system